MFRDISSSDVYSVVTPSNSVNFPVACRGIYVGVGGTVVAVPLSGVSEGTAVSFVGVASGTILPVSAIRINSTGTTAASLVALF